MDLRDKFREIIKSRRTLISPNILNFNDEKQITDLLCIDYDETVKFLSGATNIEIACAIDALMNLAKELSNDKVKTIIEIFKQKKEQFKNIQDFTSTNYDEQIRLAEKCIK